MKFFALTAAYVAVANAAPSSSENGVNGRKLGQTRDMLAHYLDMDQNAAKNFMRNYGCYCYPLASQKVGPAFNYNAEPVDEMDHLCKKLWRAQKCIEIDSTNGVYEKACDVGQAYGMHLNEDTNELICGTEENQSQQDKLSCRFNMCELEKDFATKVADLVKSGYERNQAYKNMNEEEYRNTCERVAGSGAETELACCGTGLKRKTYNTLTSQCCDGDRVESFGSC